MIFFKKPRLFGLMITRNNIPILYRWMDRHLKLFDKLAVVDGSTTNETEVLCKKYPNILYTKDPDTHITDQTLRAAGWNLLEPFVRKGDWILLCHPDEFYIHNPHFFLKIRAPIIEWNALHILPHPSEKKSWEEADGNKDVTKLFFHYWWKENGRATVEPRMFQIIHEPIWDIEDPKPSSFVLPVNFRSFRRWRKNPAYFHYKIQHLNVKIFEGTSYIDSQLDTGMGRTREFKNIDDFFFDENRPWGHKGFTKFSNNSKVPEFDPFKGRLRM